MKPSLTVSMSHNGNVLWRWSEDISDKAMTRLGVNEYRAVVRAAEKELANQIKLSKKKESKDDSGLEDNLQAR